MLNFMLITLGSWSSFLLIESCCKGFFLGNSEVDLQKANFKSSHKLLLLLFNLELEDASDILNE